MLRTRKDYGHITCSSRSTFMFIAKLLYKRNKPNPYICESGTQLSIKKKEVLEWKVNGYLTQQFLQWLDDTTDILDKAADILKTNYMWQD